GDVLAVGDRAGVRLWDAGNGKSLQTLQSTLVWIRSVALSPDGQFLTGTGMGIWEATTGKLVQEAPGTKPFATVFSKDGKYLSGVGPDATAVWETATGKKLDHLSGPGNRVPCAALSPDGQLLAIGSVDGILRLWDWAAAKEVRQLATLPLPIHTVAFSRDGKTL